MKNYLVVLSLLIVSACASVPMTSPEQDQMAKQFNEPTTDKSHLYIFRDEIFGTGIKAKLGLDGRVLGETLDQTYFFQEIKPGPHYVTSTTLTTDTLNFTAEKGEVYFIWQDIRPGFVTIASKLRLASRERGQAGVLASKRILVHKPEFDFYLD